MTARPRALAASPTAIAATVAVVAIVAVGVVAVVRFAIGGTAAVPPPVSDLHVGGVVFDDADGDGLLSGGEHGMAGIEVTITSTESGNERVVTTGDDGSFVAPIGASPSVVVSATVMLAPPEHAHEDVPISLVRRAGPGDVVEFAVTAEQRECDGPCDGMLLPDLVSLGATPDFLPLEVQAEYAGPDRWLLDRTTQPGHTLLRVPTISANVGDGPLLVVGTDHHDTEFAGTAQRLLDAGGSYQDIAAGTFAESESHGHVHLQALEEIRLLDGDDVVVSTSKISFCLTDVFAVEPPPRAPAPVELDLELFDCGIEQQGINVGMADYYGPMLPEQFIDVTDVPLGIYTLEIVTDPDEVLVESDESNNRVSFTVDLADPPGSI